MASVIAALYAALTIVFSPISFSAVQVRIAEALNILPMFTSAAIPGLFIGCLLGNLFSGALFMDTLFGSLATLVGAYFGYKFRHERWLVPVPSIIANSLIIPFILRCCYGVELPIGLLMIYIAAGEFLGSYVLGELFGSFLLKHKAFFRKEELLYK